MFWILPLSLLILFEIIADIFSKEWALHGHWLRWTGAISGYLLANIFWLFAIRGSGLARGATIFAVASAIIAVLLGLFLYKEHLSHMQLMGVGIGILSLIFIFWN